MRLSVHMKQFEDCWTDFHEILYWEVLVKDVDEFKFFFSSFFFPIRLLMDTLHEHLSSYLSVFWA